MLLFFNMVSCAYGRSNSHTFSCPNGVFSTIHRNGIQDPTAELMSEVCHYVPTEPSLIPLSSVCETERSNFGPLVFSTSGGMGATITVAYKRVAFLLMKETLLQGNELVTLLSHCHHVHMGSVSSLVNTVKILFQPQSTQYWRKDTSGLPNPKIMLNSTQRDFKADK